MEAVPGPWWHHAHLHHLHQSARARTLGVPAGHLAVRHAGLPPHAEGGAGRPHFRVSQRQPGYSRRFRVNQRQPGYSVRAWGKRALAARRTTGCAHGSASARASNASPATVWRRAKGEEDAAAQGWGREDVVLLRVKISELLSLRLGL
eukprot:1196791-Rhodomonas_salina.5